MNVTWADLDLLGTRATLAAEWSPRGTTQALSLEQLGEAAHDLAQVGATLQGTNSYADGPRRDLDAAFRTLYDELVRAIRAWGYEPPDDEEE